MVARPKYRDVLHAIRQAVTALLGWSIGYPLTFFVPRDESLTVVIGRRGDVFADNSKYFFIHSHQARKRGDRVVFLGGSKRVLDQIRAAGADASIHPGLRSLWLALRCKRIVVDMAEWFDYGVYPLSRGAEIIQLWHGAPLKHIELDVYRGRLETLPRWARLLVVAQKRVLGRYPVYDTVVTTSTAFTDKAFKRSFHTRRFLATGYPRNDILTASPDTPASELLEINVDRDVQAAIEKARNSKQRVALYVPTFRANGESPFDKAIDPESLSRFAQQNNLLVIVKLHPVMHSIGTVRDETNVIYCSPLSDVYPLMAKCDLLITDYSSIYFDFLLLDRPIVFFAYDLERYVENERGMYFQYKDMTPGELCGTQEGLEEVLTSILQEGCRDNFSAQREALCRFTHDHREVGSVARLIEALGKS